MNKKPIKYGQKIQDGGYFLKASKGTAKFLYHKWMIYQIKLLKIGKA
jgi:hypothetical protein